VKSRTVVRPPQSMDDAQSARVQKTDRRSQRRPPNTAPIDREKQIPETIVLCANRKSERRAQPDAANQQSLEKDALEMAL